MNILYVQIVLALRNLSFKNTPEDGQMCVRNM